VFKNNEIKIIDVPYFEELTAKKVFNDIKQNPIFSAYLPDADVLRKPLNRQYLFNVSSPSFHSILIFYCSW